jgi:hypothetical protein
MAMICGLFAIANLVEFYLNDATYNYKNEFVLNKMQEDLSHCLQRGEFSKFPKETICKTSALKYEIIQIGCNCSYNIFSD